MHHLWQARQSKLACLARWQATHASCLCTSARSARDPSCACRDDNLALHVGRVTCAACEKYTCPAKRLRRTTRLLAGGRQGAHLGLGGLLTLRRLVAVHAISQGGKRRHGLALHALVQARHFISFSTWRLWLMGRGGRVVTAGPRRATATRRTERRRRRPGRIFDERMTRRTSALYNVGGRLGGQHV